MSGTDDQTLGVATTAEIDAAFSRRVVAASIAGPLIASAFVLLITAIIIAERAISEGIHPRDGWPLIVTVVALVSLTALSILVCLCGGNVRRMSAALLSVFVLGAHSSMFAAIAWLMRLS